MKRSIKYVNLSLLYFDVFPGKDRHNGQMVWALDSQTTDPVSSPIRFESDDRLAQLVEHRTAVRAVAGSNLGRTNTQGL